MRFDRNLVFVKAEFGSKEEVIDFLGNQLVQAGAVHPDYVKAMHQREADIGTYITDGVAIPHGTEESRSLVKKAAIVVLKVAQGIDWIDGQKVYLAFGIAGNNDDHVTLLSELAGILMDDSQKGNLMSAKNEEELFAYIDKNIE